MPADARLVRRAPPRPNSAHLFLRLARALTDALAVQVVEVVPARARLLAGRAGGELADEEPAADRRAAAVRASADLRLQLRRELSARAMALTDVGPGVVSQPDQINLDVGPGDKALFSGK